MQYYEFNEDATWIKKSGERVQVCCLVMELLEGVELLDFLNETKGLKDDSLLRYIFLDLAKTIH